MLFVDASPCMLRFVRVFDLTTKMELTWVEYRKMHDHAWTFNFHCKTMKGRKKKLSHSETTPRFTGSTDTAWISGNPSAITRGWKLMTVWVKNAEMKDPGTMVDLEAL